MTQVAGTVAMAVADLSLSLLHWVRRRSATPTVLNVTIMPIRFWPRALLGVGVISFFVGSTLLIAAGQLNGLTVLGGSLGLTALTLLIVQVRKSSPATMIYDSDKPGL